MTFSIAVLLFILLVAIVCFAMEVMPVDKISFLILVSLVFTGLVTAEEGISGFSNPAVITILLLMILVSGLEENGVIELLVSKLAPLAKYPTFVVIPILLVFVGTFSSFISTTAVVIVFVKLLTDLAEKHNLNRGHFLLPVSFAGILGGSCTMMGTSTNLLVSSLAVKNGLDSFTFFEFTQYGVIFFVVALVIITVLAPRLLPTGQSVIQTAKFHLDDYVTIVRVDPDSKLVGKRLDETFLYDKDNIKISRLRRDNSNLSIRSNVVLRADDMLFINSNAEELVRINNRDELNLIPYVLKDEEEKENLENFKTHEVIILPGSHLIGKKYSTLRASDLGGASPLGIMKNAPTVHYFRRSSQKKNVLLRLEAGDRLLVQGGSSEMEYLHKNDNVVLIDEPISVNIYDRKKTFLSIVILLLTIAMAASGQLSILESSLMGCLLLFLSGCLELSRVYHKINWQVIFLLVGMIPLGTAMQNSGTDMYIADKLSFLLAQLSPSMIISVIFLVTMLMSGIISNNATAIIMVPIVLAISSNLQIEVKPLLYAILFAANFSFFTPVGYQTNAIVYGLGIYRFRDFAILGGILSTTLWLIASYILA